MRARCQVLLDCPFHLQMQIATTMHATDLFNKLLVSITEHSDYENFLEFLTRKQIATVEKAEVYGDELLRFLFLKSCNPDISPSPVVDRCWHCLLLMPVLYKRVCKILLSHAFAQDCDEGIIAHNPLGGDNRVARNRRYAKCIVQYWSHFPDGPLLSHLWPQEYNGAATVAELVAGVASQSLPTAREPDAAGENEKDAVSDDRGSASVITGSSATVSADVSGGEVSPDHDDAVTSNASEDSLYPVPEPTPTPRPQASVLITMRDPCGNAVMLFKTLRSTPFSKVFAAYANRSTDASSDAVHFTYDGKDVVDESTADSLGASDAVVLQAHPTSVPATANAPLPTITITLRDTKGTNKRFKMRYCRPFSKVFRSYADKIGTDVNELRFLYDGVRVGPNDTAASLQMADGDVIDVLRQQMGC